MGSFNGDFSAVRFYLHTKSSMFKEIHLTIFLGVVINNFSVYTGDWGYLCVWVLSFVGKSVWTYEVPASLWKCHTHSFYWLFRRDHTISTQKKWWPSKVKIHLVTRIWFKAMKILTSYLETRRKTETKTLKPTNERGRRDQKEVTGLKLWDHRYISWEELFIKILYPLSLSALMMNHKWHLKKKILKITKDIHLCASCLLLMVTTSGCRCCSLHSYIV